MEDALVKIYFDGGSRGNPGPAAGAAFADFDGGKERACFIDSATNNEAEYRGLLMAIELAKEHRLSRVLFLGDSKLVVMQVTGQWKAKHPMMNELKLKVLEEIKSIPKWTIDWIPRESNSEADRVANETMDRHQGLEPLIKVPTLEKAKTAELSQTPAPAGLRADIHRINELASKVSFKDLSGLKVGGMDAFSRSTLDALQGLIADFASVKAGFMAKIAGDRNTQNLADLDQDKLLINALRWSARGLHTDLAIRKVLVDLEVSSNIRGKKR